LKSGKYETDLYKFMERYGMFSTLMATPNHTNILTHNAVVIILFVGVFSRPTV